MILYLDSSALVKRYIAERGSHDVGQWIQEAEAIGVSILARVEVTAAITRATRMNVLSAGESQRAIDVFRSEWENIQRLPVGEQTVIRADYLACAHGLRGYDAVHMACALLWQEILGLPITFATYDSQLWQAANVAGLKALPGSLN